MEHYVDDVELTVPDRKPADSTVKRAIPVPRMTKVKREYAGHNGKCVVRKVSEEEMDRLWI